MTTGKPRLAVALFSGAVTLGVSSVSAGVDINLNVDFEPAPDTPDTPELIFDGTTLSAGPGLALPNLLAFSEEKIPGGSLNSVVLTFTDLVANGPVVTVGSFFFQQLTGGSYQFTDTSSNTVVMEGSLGDVELSGFLGSTQFFLDGDWDITAGTLLRNHGTQARYIEAFDGSFRLNLFTAEGVAASGDQLAPFEANADGQFEGVATLVPEPASVIMLASGVWLMAGRLRRR